MNENKTKANNNVGAINNTCINEGRDFYYTNDECDEIDKFEELENSGDYKNFFEIAESQEYRDKQWH